MPSTPGKSSIVIAEIDPQSTRKKVSYDLSAALVRRLRLVAAIEDRHQYEVVESALEDYLGRRGIDTSRPFDVAADHR